MSQSSRVPLPASPTLQLFRLPILKPSMDSGARPLQALVSPSCPPTPSETAAPSTVPSKIVWGEEQSRTGPLGVGAWQFPPGWLFAYIQGRIHALALLNPMSLIWSAPSFVTRSAIFSLLKGEETRHIPPPSFSSVQQCFSSFGKG